MKKIYLSGLIFSLLLLSVNARITAQVNKGNENSTTVYTSVEMGASFPGGTLKLQNFIQDKFKAPRKASNKKIKGIVYLKFKVEKDGFLSEINAVSDLGYGINDEFVRVLKLSPKWISASINGKPVQAMGEIPVMIDLTGKKSIRILSLH